MPGEGENLARGRAQHNCTAGSLQTCLLYTSPVTIKGVINIENSSARISKNGVHLLFQQTLHNDLCACQCHIKIPPIFFWGTENLCSLAIQKIKKPSSLSKQRRRRKSSPRYHSYCRKTATYTSNNAFPHNGGNRAVAYLPIERSAACSRVISRSFRAALHQPAALFGEFPAFRPYQSISFFYCCSLSYSVSKYLSRSGAKFYHTAQGCRYSE